GVPDPFSEVRRIGQMPTPPYIRERLADRERYQTVFAREEGSAGAPPAGLHFTPELLNAIRDRGVNLAFVTLHVGLDTFQPVRVDDPSQHSIHREWFRIDEATANAVNDTRRRGNRVVAVGTTSVRTLESAAAGNRVRAGDAWTGLLILPGHRFQVVDAVITNFHLPKSTLLLLGNTYPLGLRPGADRIARLGGLHRFMGWDGPILTDSGGYQVFSLDHLVRVTDDGATFRSHLDGSEQRFTPESVMAMQRELG